MSVVPDTDKKIRTLGPKPCRYYLHWPFGSLGEQTCSFLCCDVGFGLKCSRCTRANADQI